jgi:hypothetical protein
MKSYVYVLIAILALLAGMAGGIVSSRFFSKTTPQEEGILVANEFRLVNEEGHVLAKWRMENGEPMLAFRMQNDKRRVRLGADSSGDLTLALYHTDGHPRILLGVSLEGGPFLDMLDKDEKVHWSAP